MVSRAKTVLHRPISISPILNASLLEQVKFPKAPTCPEPGQLQPRWGRTAISYAGPRWRPDRPSFSSSAGLFPHFHHTPETRQTNSKGRISIPNFNIPTARNTLQNTLIFPKGILYYDTTVLPGISKIIWADNSAKNIIHLVTHTRSNV